MTSLVEHFVLCGYEPFTLANILSPMTQDSNSPLSNSTLNVLAPIVDIIWVSPSLSEMIPPGFSLLTYFDDPCPVNFNTIEQPMYLCYRREPQVTPITDIFVSLACPQVQGTFGNRSTLPESWQLLQQCDNYTFPLSRTVHGTLAFLEWESSFRLLMVKRQPSYDPVTLLVARKGPCLANDDPWCQEYQLTCVTRYFVSLPFHLYISRKSLEYTTEAQLVPNRLQSYSPHQRPLLPTLPLFCHPDGKISVTMPMSCLQLSTLVLTDSDSFQHHVILLYYYEKGNGNVFVRQCLALVSPFPWYKTWCDVLVALMDRGKTPLVRLVLHLCEVPVPIPGKFRVIWPSPSFPIAFTLKDRNQLPDASFPVTLLFGYLSVSNIVQILHFILLEQKIIFHAYESSLLNAMIEILCDLLFPLKWPYMKVAMLPASLLEFLQAPTPYLIGMSTRTLESHYDALPDGIYLVDLNKNTITHSTNVNRRTTVWFPTRTLAVLPALPALSLFDEWNVQLSKVMQHLSQTKQKLYQDTTLCPYTETLTVPTWTLAAVLPDDFVPQLSMHQYRSVIRECCLQFMIQLLYNYPAYLQPPTEDTSSLPLFDSKAFMQRFAPQEVAFYERFLSTQMWMKFMEERIYGASADREAELLFFEHRMNEKNTGNDAVQRHYRKKSGNSHPPAQVFVMPALEKSEGEEEDEIRLNGKWIQPLRDFSNAFLKREEVAVVKQDVLDSETVRPRASTLPTHGAVDAPRYIRRRGRSFRTTHDITTTTTEPINTEMHSENVSQESGASMSVALNAAKDLLQTLLSLHFTVTSQFLLMYPVLSLSVAIQSLSRFHSVSEEAYEVLLKVAAQRRDSASAKQLFTLMQQNHVVPSVRACAWMMEAMSASARRPSKVQIVKNSLPLFDWSQSSLQLEASCIQCYQVYPLDRLLAACLLDENIFTCLSCRGLVQATLHRGSETIPLWTPSQLLEKWQQQQQQTTPMKSLEDLLEHSPDLIWGALLYSVHVLDASPWPREVESLCLEGGEGDEETLSVTLQVTQLAQHCYAMPPLNTSTTTFPLSRRLSLDVLKKRHSVHRSLSEHFTLWIKERDLLQSLQHSLLELDLEKALKEFVSLKQKYRSLFLHMDPFDFFVTCPGLAVKLGSLGEVGFAQRFQQVAQGQFDVPPIWCLAIRQIFWMWRII